MKHIWILLSIFLSACSIYQVETSDRFDFETVGKVGVEKVNLKKLNEYPQGFQCFEPMMFVLTLGVVPVHCVDDYDVMVDGQAVGQARVTGMTGWVPLFMSVLPDWKYGKEPDLSKELQVLSKNASKK